MLTGDRSCEQDIGTRIAKEAFNKCKTILTKGLSRNLKKRLAKDLVWSELHYGSETMKKADAKRLDSHEIWIWRRLEKISLVDRVRNKERWRREDTVGCHLEDESKVAWTHYEIRRTDGYCDGGES